MIFADVKSNIKQQEIKDLVSASYKLLEEAFQTSNTVKRVCMFHLILVGIPSILVLSVPLIRTGRGEGGIGGLLNRQNPLSVTKVICRQSLTLIGHDSSENFFFPCMIIACGFLTFNFEVILIFGIKTNSKLSLHLQSNKTLLKYGTEEAPKMLAIFRSIFSTTR